MEAVDVEDDEVKGEEDDEVEYDNVEAVRDDDVKDLSPLCFFCSVMAVWSFRLQKHCYRQHQSHQFPGGNHLYILKLTPKTPA